MKINRLKLGPIYCSIDHSSDGMKNRFRFWGKGAKGSIGVIRIKKEEDEQYSLVKSFNLSSHYFNTGIIDILLEPDCKYVAQMGYVKTNLALEDTVELRSLKWEGLRRETFKFKTFPTESSGEKTKFILGSCRHHGSLPINRFNKSDTAFKSINKNVIEKENPDFILMTGDQVYADHFFGALRFNKPPKSKSGYYKKYLKSFKKKNFSKVLSRVATYMILDDHEVQNNFGIGKFKDIRNDEYDMASLKWGLRAYQSFQSNVSPVIKSAEHLTNDTYGELGYEGVPYYYEFYHSDCAFFVMDVRCEREGANMISAQQRDKLFDFLRENRNKIRFVVSPVPFFPDTKGVKGAPEDKWAGYSGQRNQILRSLEEEEHNDVIFLSGDVHCSFTSTIEKQNLRIHSIISSAFNWCVFGLWRRDFIWSGVVSESTIDSSYKPDIRPNKPITGNNYALVSVDKGIVEVVYYSSLGKPVSSPIIINVNRT